MQRTALLLLAIFLLPATIAQAQQSKPCRPGNADYHIPPPFVDLAPEVSAPTIESAAHSSDLVLLGHIVGMHAMVQSEYHVKTVHTAVTIAVEDIYKHSNAAPHLSSHLTLFLPGGAAIDATTHQCMEQPGIALNVQNGWTLIFFLQWNASDHSLTLTLWDTLFRVKADQSITLVGLGHHDDLDFKDRSLPDIAVRVRAAATTESH